MRAHAHTHARASSVRTLKLPTTGWWCEANKGGAGKGSIGPAHSINEAALTSRFPQNDAQTSPAKGLDQL